MMNETYKPIVRHAQGHAVMKHSEIAKMLGISRSRVQQIEEEAMFKLRVGLAGDPMVQEVLGNKYKEKA